MKVQHHEQIESQPVTMEGAVGCRVRWLIGERDGAPNFAMRQFEVGIGGHTPKHSHPYEHEVFVLEGQGEILAGNVPRPFGAGDVIFVESDEVHQFRNTGAAPLKFLCLVPNSSSKLPVTMAPECGETSVDPP